jgi:hypothetical protein
MRSLLFGAAAAAVVAGFVAVPVSLAEEPPLPDGLFGGEVEVSSPSSSSEPSLPDGLGAGEPSLSSGLSSDEPSMPEGLDMVSDSSEPSLPSGLEGESSESEYVSYSDDGGSFIDGLPFYLTGFFETRAGVRVKDDPNERNASVGEARAHLQAEKEFGAVSGRVTTDLVYNPVIGEHDIDLETGDGWLDLREAYLVGRPTDFMDLKVGRQILTWGTGDLLFINDMFPKDWNSFFVGRDEDYLKAPSDAVKVSAFSDVANLDVIYTPRFDADRFIDGRNISYFDGNTGRKAGRSSQVYLEKPDDWFNDDEWSIRAYRNFGAVEGAMYAYDGYWKSPMGQNPLTGFKTFPELSVYGASLRSPVFAGIANLEAGYYDSSDDNAGTNPLIPNDEVRVLAGYEQELIPDLTGAVQYYVESMNDYGAYKNNLPAGANQKDKNRQIVTLRLTKLAMNQNLTLSAFSFYSPSDRDGYARFRATYKVDDNWQVEGGANLFYGREEHTFFGQFDDNNNVFAAVRYSF